MSESPVPSQDRPAGDRLRVSIQQPALPAYRIPVFAALASRPGIELSVHFATEKEIDNVGAEGFAAKPTKQPTPLFGGMFWNQAQVGLAKRSSCDVLVLEWNIRLLSLVPAILKARMAGLRVIVWGHGFSKHESPIKAFFRRSAARLAHGVMFYNRGTAERHVRSHGFDPSRVYVAINSLDQRPIAGARERCVAEPDGVRALRDEHRIDGPLILYVSRLLEENRAELLFDALVVLRERFPGVTVAIIGAGPDEERLRNEAGAKGVAEHVRFLGKIYGEDRLSWWFSASDVFCYPQNIGLAMMHAMGYGVPVVTSDSPDLHGPEIEALVNGENGLLYKHGDGADLAEKLAAILSDPDLRARMSEAALETVRERFSLDRMVDGYEAAVRGSAPVDSFR